jgi:outer membrane protein assembly factor BamB
VTKWRSDFYPGQALGLPPCVSGDVVLLATSAYVTAVSLEKGEPIWYMGFRKSGLGISCAATQGDTFLLGIGSTIQALSVEGGEFVWRSELPDMVRSLLVSENPAMSLYVTTATGELFVIGD